MKAEPRVLMPHPDDLAARASLAKRPQPPLQKIYDQIEQARQWRSKHSTNSPKKQTA